MHSDFIFAVAAEEYGRWPVSPCWVFMALSFFAACPFAGRRVILPNCQCQSGHAIWRTNCIHMASSINLIPTKGMTLPFISYGGSSLLASGLTIGLILALTRKRVGQNYIPRGPAHTGGAA